MFEEWLRQECNNSTPFLQLAMKHASEAHAPQCPMHTGFKVLAMKTLEQFGLRSKRTLQREMPGQELHELQGQLVFTHCVAVQSDAIHSCSSDTICS